MAEHSLRIHILGKILVEVAGSVVLHEGQLRGKQGRLAFAYLVANRGRSISKADLAGVLWPEGAPPAWEGALSALLSRPRRLLSAVGDGSTTIHGASGHYELSIPSDAWIDVDVATRAIDEAEGCLRRGAFKEAFGPAALAATLVRREFLPGIDCAWADSERARLRRMHLRALDCITEVWLLNDEPALAVESATDAIAVDRLRERSYQLLMTAHANAGHPSEAIKTYHTLREVLAKEVGTDPSQPVQQQYQRLLD